MIRPNTDQERMYGALKFAGARGLTIDELMDIIYSKRIDGGPIWARTSVHVMKNALNHKLKFERIETVFNYNWRRQGRRYVRGTKPRYRLIRL